MKSAFPLFSLTAPASALPAIFSAILLCQSALAADPNNVDPSNDAKNLARMNCGTRIHWISSDATAPTPNRLGRATAKVDDLILDDNTLDYRLHPGQNTLLITLQNIALLDRFGFINEEAEAAGTIRVSISNYRLPLDDRKWVPVDNGVSFSGKRFVDVSLAGTEAKYIKVSFSVEKPGKIAGLGLYGRKTLESFADQQGRARDNSSAFAYTTAATNLQDNLNFNFANLYAKARVVYVSSGPAGLVHSMIDDDPSTGFDFAPEDPHPTVIVELARSERLRRVSAIYEMQSGRLDIYLLNTLPTDLSRLGEMRPAVSLTDQDGSGKAAADFEPHGAHYVALRWTRGQSGGEHHSFKISEIGAFSDFSIALLDYTQVPERLGLSAAALNPPIEPPVVVPNSP